MDKQLEPWEGYRGPPVPEGTDASQIPVLRRASEWRDYDPSLHYVNCSRGASPGSGVGIPIFVGVNKDEVVGVRFTEAIFASYVA